MKNRDILSEREIGNLSEQKLKKIERYNSSFEQRELAEAKKEYNKGLRNVFERAPPETIPFLVYCIYVGASGLLGFIFIVSKFSDIMFYISLAFLFVIMITPIFILPKFHIKKAFSWICNFTKFRKKNKPKN